MKEKKYETTDLPMGLKVISDVKKQLNITTPENLDFLILTDSQSLDRDDIKTSKLYVMMNKTGAKNLTISNESFTLTRNLRDFNVVIILDATSGQIEKVKNEYSKKVEVNKNDAELQSKENQKLKDTFKKITTSAFEDKVSDIHIEKRKTFAVVKMRKNGELRLYEGDQDVDYITNLCSWLYNTEAESEGKDVSFMPDTFQQAAIQTIINGEEVKLRYQSLPTYPEGFDVVLRMLPLGKDDEKIVPLTQLGFEVSQDKMIKDIISKPVGALIIAGTTGSGKSTTLKNLLMSVNLSREYKCKIYTIEDPPEYKIPHVSQMPVKRNEKKDKEGRSDPTFNPFAAPLLAAMRGDPDLIMIGEIRDALTGDGLKKATQSGHQVMTTVHASSGLGITERMMDFNISPNIMSSPEFITGLIYQKLLPTVCPHCAEDFSKISDSASVSDDVIELQKRLDEVFQDIDKTKIKIKVRNNKGCEECKNTGISGRTICAEIIQPDFELLNFFKNQDVAGALKYWLETSDEEVLSSNMRGKSAQEHAIYKMANGIISPFDLEIAFGPVNHTRMKRAQLAAQKDSNSKVFDILKDYYNISDEEIKKVRSANSISKKLKDNESENVQNVKQVDITEGFMESMKNK